jgi:hypothetical protein
LPRVAARCRPLPTAARFIAFEIKRYEEIVRLSGARLD